MGRSPAAADERIFGEAVAKWPRVRCASPTGNPAEIATSVVVRTASGEERRDLYEVVDELKAYEDAGCEVAFVEARADHPCEAAEEIERLTAACEALAV